MKVGEAGEAFFVFETDSDVPDDLITSPLLEPTQPVSPDPPPAGDFGRFGTRNRSGDFTDDGLSQEPDFLDLNAPSTSLSGEALKTSASSNLAPPSHTPIPFPTVHPPDALSPDHSHHTSVSLPRVQLHQTNIPGSGADFLNAHKSIWKILTRAQLL